MMREQLAENVHHDAIAMIVWSVAWDSRPLSNGMIAQIMKAQP